MEKRMRFVLEVACETAAAIGGDKLGIRLSPYGTNAGMGVPPVPLAFRQALPLNAPDADTFFTPGVKGYTDYPVAAV